MENQAAARVYGLDTVEGAQVRNLSKTAVIATGIAQGAQIRTLEGDLPIEYLCPGDRIVTRSGMRVLRAVSVRQAKCDVFCIAASSMGHGRPQGALYVGARTRLRVTGWRAEVLYGAPAVEIETRRLCDGEQIRAVSGRSVYLYTLHFDSAETVFAEGIEVAADTVCTGTQTA